MMIICNDQYIYNFIIQIIDIITLLKYKKYNKSLLLNKNKCNIL